MNEQTPKPALDEQALITHIPSGQEMAEWQKEREARLSHFEDTLTPGALRAVIAGSTKDAANLNLQFPAPPRTGPSAGEVNRSMIEGMPEREPYIPDPSERVIRGAEMEALRAKAMQIHELNQQQQT